MNTDSNLLQRVSEELAPPTVAGYLQRALPCELDNDVTKIVDQYIVGSEQTRRAISGMLDERQAFGLLAYAERMSSLAIEKASRKPLLQGLTAIAIGGFAADVREAIIILSLLDHSARKLEINSNELFEEAAKIAPQDSANHLRKFSERRLEEKSIKAMGYSEEVSANKLRYTRNW